MSGKINKVKGMVKHKMKDGTTPERVDGYTVPHTAARLAYEVMERIRKGEGRNEKKTDERCGSENDHRGGGC